VKSRKIKNKFEVASRKIRNGSIVGWFQNGAEFGPRALGNRSILADPSNNNIKELVNSRIKYREDFRPFAPAIMEKCARDYFSLDFPSPNMTIAVKAKEFARDMIPGVIHADETARVQTVTRNYNSTFYSLLENFMSETGIPALLNTSFNIKGEPIVNSPRDAIRTFYSSGLDTLVIDDFLIEK
jgi:carbamoyltransferase